MTPRLGTDGSRIVYPVRGIVQGARDISRHPQRRTHRLRLRATSRRRTGGRSAPRRCWLHARGTLHGARASGCGRCRRADQRAIRGSQARPDSTEEQSISPATDAIRRRAVRTTRWWRCRSRFDARRSRAHRSSAIQIAHRDSSGRHTRARGSSAALQWGSRRRRRWPPSRPSSANWLRRRLLVP